MEKTDDSLKYQPRKGKIDILQLTETFLFEANKIGSEKNFSRSTTHSRKKTEFVRYMKNLDDFDRDHFINPIVITCNKDKSIKLN